MAFWYIFDVISFWLFGHVVIADVFLTFATQLQNGFASNLEQEQTHTHTHILACTSLHMHMCTVGMHTTHTYTHTCNTYIDALVRVVCCFVRVNIELAMGMM